jgi:hypothetical protein
MTDALLGRGTYRSTAGYELSDEHHRLLYLGTWSLSASVAIWLAWSRLTGHAGTGL